MSQTQSVCGQDKGRGEQTEKFAELRQALPAQDRMLQQGLCSSRPALPEQTEERALTV